MSSIEETLKKYFNEIMTGSTDGTNNQFGTLEDLINWFEKIQLFEKLKILQSDFEESFAIMCEKYRTPIAHNNASPNITFEDFNRILDELAVKLKLEAVQLKKILLELIENSEQYEKAFKDFFKKGQENIEHFTDWLWSTKVFENMKIAKAEVIEYFKNSQQNAGNFSYEDFIKGVKEIATKYNIDAQELLTKIIENKSDPGLLPLPEHDEN